MPSGRGEPSRLPAPSSADRKSRVRYRLPPRGLYPSRVRPRRPQGPSPGPGAGGPLGPLQGGEQQLGVGVWGRGGLNPRPLPGPPRQPFPHQTPGRKVLSVQCGQCLPTLQKPPFPVSAGGLPTVWGVERRDSGLLGTVGLPGSPGRCCGPAGPSRVTPGPLRCRRGPSSTSSVSLLSPGPDATKPTVS